MALIDLGITKDEALAAGAQVGPGEYDAEYVGLLVDQVTGDVVWTSDVSGGKMLKPTFKVVNHPDPLTNGKRLPIYNAVAGSFSLSDFMEAIPEFWGPDGPDRERGIGTVVRVTVKFGKGEYAERTQISKIRPRR